MNAKENILKAIKRDGPEWVPNNMESFIFVKPPIAERPEKAGLDCFGCLWSLEESAEGGTFPATGAYVLDSLEGWREKLVLPDVDSLDWVNVTKQTENIDRSKNLICGFVEMGLFERSYLLLGMEEALVCYMTEPEEMRELLRVLADYKIRLIRRFYEAIRPDMIWYGDDWGTQRNTFLPPKIWRKIVRPETQRIYDCIKSLGMMVNQHSCGKIEEIFGDIVEMGADIWNPCQPCNNLRRLKQEYGDRISFCGGIDSQFVLAKPGVTPEEVDAEVKQRMEEMKGVGGYIAAPSHSVPYDPAALDAMNEAIRKYGRYER